MKEIEPEDSDEEMMNYFLQAMDEVSNVLYRIELRRRKRFKTLQELRATDKNWPLILPQQIMAFARCTNAS